MVPSGAASLYSSASCFAPSGSAQGLEGGVWLLAPLAPFFLCSAAGTEPCFVFYGPSPIPSPPQLCSRTLHVIVSVSAAAPSVGACAGLWALCPGCTWHQRDGSGECLVPWACAPLSQGGGLRHSCCGVGQSRRCPANCCLCDCRFDILDREMSTPASQIDGINRAATSLVESGHPRSGRIRQCQERLNTRYRPTPLLPRERYCQSREPH